jgi:hypothetical protein
LTACSALLLFHGIPSKIRKVKSLSVLAQREMEKGRSSLVHRFRPFGAGIF